MSSQFQTDSFWGIPLLPIVISSPATTKPWPPASPVTKANTTDIGTESTEIPPPRQPPPRILIPPQPASPVVSPAASAPPSRSLLSTSDLLQPPESALSTRSGTPATPASTAPTSPDLDADNLVPPEDDQTIQPTPPLDDGPTSRVEISTLSLPPLETILESTQLPEVSSRCERRCSWPRLPAIHPASTQCDTSRSCPVSPQLDPQTPPAVPNQPTYKPSRSERPFDFQSSKAAQEWIRRKLMDGEENDVLDELMQYEGLEEVKQLFLDVKSKVDVCKEQGRDLKSERFNAVFQGNPGTGKTTIARLYAEFLYSLDILECDTVKETSGIKAAAKGPVWMKRKIRNMIDNGGGLLFVDEAYQLTVPYVGDVGRQVLDIMLTMMENHIGELVIVFVGYKDEMEPFFEHNPGLSSRIPYTVNFADFTDGELWKILSDKITDQYKGKMRVEDGMHGLYMRVAIRRLAQNRGSKSFGNARAVENLLARISHRQAHRLAKEKKYSTRPDHFFLTKEDLIGPDPSKAVLNCTALAKLNCLTGLDQVKDCVRRMVGMIQLNYHRELHELNPLRFSLNQLFVGAPGTGKTTVTKLFGRILADLGYLSRGDVVLKNPADFIGECLGKSEAKTRKILEATIGKVLVIDEVYALDPGDSSKDQDKFKSGVIDTIVSMVQGVPGEDRCIILVGYEDKVKDMFYHVNPDLSRRFPIDRPFRFENFTISQLVEILRMKMHDQDLSCTEQAIDTARDIFQRALMRPNFTNAGVVDSALSTAKMNYEMRLSDIPIHDQDFNTKLDAVDFDPNSDRGSRPGLDCRKMLEGLVHSSIVDKLVGYQKSCLTAREHGLNPRDHVPTNFVFKGFPGMYRILPHLLPKSAPPEDPVVLKLNVDESRNLGTGKTVTAQQMGKVFYDMGFLSTAEVIECSATDLLGQFVGQTAPKTQKKLQDAMGRVLFIDEAYRLIHGEYAAQAVEELIQFLVKPANQGKVVVILTGYTADMHALMSRWPVLNGLFPEEIVFDNLPPEDCISLLVRELQGNRFKSEADFLETPDATDYNRVKRLFRAMQLFPSWSNARDVKNLSKKLVEMFLESNDRETRQPRTLSVSLITECMSRVITQQRDRCIVSGSNGYMSLPRQPPLGAADAGPKLMNQLLAPAPPTSASDICTPGAGGSCATIDRVEIDTEVDQSQRRNHTYERSLPISQAAEMRVQIEHSNMNDDEDAEDSEDATVASEQGVSDLVREELAKAQTTQNALHIQRDVEVKRLKQELQDAEDRLSRCNGGDRDGLSAVCADVKNKLSKIQRQILTEEKKRLALREMNRCPYGYSWTRVQGGYRCDGGSHFVGDHELEARIH